MDVGAAVGKHSVLSPVPCPPCPFGNALRPAIWVLLEVLGWMELSQGCAEGQAGAAVAWRRGVTAGRGG